MAQALAAGDTAPLIALRDQDGIERRSDQLGGKALVLFFYPKDDTPGCTMEACAFRDSQADLQALGAEVWGVSGDDAASHQRFAGRHGLNFPLLVDQGNGLRKAFGVPGVLMLLATLGMMLIVSSASYLSLYMGLELQSLALYVLAAFNRDHLRSTEAGLKYFVLGALSSGMLLYGISLIYGFTGSTAFSAIAKVTAQDFVMDLGSGDGRNIIAAAKRGALARGVEYNPDMVELSTKNAEKAGVSARARFIKADLFETDLSSATVITMYLLPSINVKLRPKILNLKPGTRVVSHAFTMDDWQADQTESFDGRTAYMWIVPAKVDGAWQFAQGEIFFTQTYQMLAGNVRTGSGTVAITEGRVRGDQVFFKAGGTEYSGRLNGKTLEGTMSGATSGAFSANRK